MNFSSGNQFVVNIVYHPEKPGEAATEESISFLEKWKAEAFVVRQRRLETVKSCKLIGSDPHAKVVRP